MLANKWIILILQALNGLLILVGQLHWSDVVSPALAAEISLGDTTLLAALAIIMPKASQQTIVAQKAALGFFTHT